MIALADCRCAVLHRLLEPEGASVAGFDVQEVPGGPVSRTRARNRPENTPLECDAGLDRTTGSR
jgi:hypothetical protein